MKNLLSVLIVVIFFSGCATNTIVLDSWKDSETSIEKEQFKKVSVVALVKNDLTRKRIESRFAEINPIFHPTNHFLNKETDIDKDMFVKLLKSEHVDGVVTMRLVDVKKESDYIQGSTMPYYNYYGSAYGYGSLFGGWYSVYSPYYYNYTPSYYVENTYFIIETNIFSVKENKLIWSAVTKTLQFNDIEMGLNDIIQALVNQMKKDGSLQLD